MPTAAEDLRALIASRHGLLVVDSRDESGLIVAATEAATLCQAQVWLWTPADGLYAVGHDPQSGTRDPAKALAFLTDIRKKVVVLLLDGQPILDDPVAARSLKEFGDQNTAGSTAILTGVGAQVPELLLGTAIRWDLAPPDREHMTALVERIVASLPRSGWRVSITDLEPLVDAVMGLTSAEAERVILKQAAIDGRLDPEDAAAATRARAELLSDGPLDLIDADVNFTDVAGLQELKAWLRIRGKGFAPEARDFGLEPPRGVLLVGVPGCGKSLIARAIAGSWEMTLAGLDVARLHGSYVGQSEKQLREALLAAEAMAPVVLWIDEIEKAFAGAGDSDSGASRRVLGVLLRWLQERPDGVFVVATSNDVTSLPPEMARRGRFDELFFVDLPDALERSLIIEYHLRSRNRDPQYFDINALCQVTEGFSGSEIESMITAALYSAFADESTLTTEYLLDEAHSTIPLSATRAEDIGALRDWAKGRTRPAGGHPPPTANG
ncbi:MAG: ATPase [Micrococcales bacterium]|nr:ATPase [Micrococcales bacterium]